MTVDINKVINRFMILKRTLRIADAREICAYFNEKELDEVLYLLAELKVMKGDDLK